MCRIFSSVTATSGLVLKPGYSQHERRAAFLLRCLSTLERFLHFWYRCFQGLMITEQMPNKVLLHRAQKWMDLRKTLDLCTPLSPLLRGHLNQVWSFRCISESCLLIAKLHLGVPPFPSQLLWDHLLWTLMFPLLQSSLINLSRWHDEQLTDCFGKTSFCGLTSFSHTVSCCEYRVLFSVWVVIIAGLPSLDLVVGETPAQVSIRKGFWS